MELHELMSAMESEFANAIAENNKFQNGNNSAGTRLRKHMQSIKKKTKNHTNLCLWIQCGCNGMTMMWVQFLV